MWSTAVYLFSTFVQNVQPNKRNRLHTFFFSILGLFALYTENDSNMILRTLKIPASVKVFEEGFIGASFEAIEYADNPQLSEIKKMLFDIVRL